MRVIVDKLGLMHVEARRATNWTWCGITGLAVEGFVTCFHCLLAEERFNASSRTSAR